MDMDELHKYWTISTVRANGKNNIQEIALAKDFVLEEFPQLIAQADLLETDDTCIQENLLFLCRENLPNIRAKAALALRCCVSQFAMKACYQLVNSLSNNSDQIGKLTCEELFPYVLNDDGSLIQADLNKNHGSLSFNIGSRHQLLFQPFTLQVLEKFNFNRTDGLSLKNWTFLLVKRHNEVKKILAEHNIKLFNPWQELIRIRPDQLQRLGEHYNWSSNEIERKFLLLKILRDVYQQERMQNLRQHQGVDASKERLESTNPLIQRMFSILRKDNIPIHSLDILVTELKDIGKFLRQHKQNICKPESLDAPLPKSDTESTLHEVISSMSIKNDVDDIEQRDFERLKEYIQHKFQPFYKPKRLNLLDQAIRDSIDHRLAYIQNSPRITHQPSQYISALQHYYCDGLFMGEIALRMGLRAQDAVSRLLKLSPKPRPQSGSSRLLEISYLIPDSMLRMLKLLRDLFIDWSMNDTEVKHSQILAELEHLQIGNDKSYIWLNLLDEQMEDITNIFKEAAQEIYDSTNCSRNSIFAQRIRHFINN
ncbi:hypothetical protein H6F61_21105 [Cyanobacteria bacterium FACHB-472]|nr:hypothetical protein [Cyanobacteria bacterium FACHB-472]